MDIMEYGAVQTGMVFCLFLHNPESVPGKARKGTLKRHQQNPWTIRPASGLELCPPENRRRTRWRHTGMPASGYSKNTCPFKTHLRAQNGHFQKRTCNKITYFHMAYKDINGRRIHGSTPFLETQWGCAGISFRKGDGIKYVNPMRTKSVPEKRRDC